MANGTVWNVVNIRVREIKGQTVAGLAKALEVPEDELSSRAQARIKRPDEVATREAQLMNYFRELPASSQADLIVLARALHATHAPKAADIKNIKKKSGRRRTA